MKKNHLGDIGGITLRTRQLAVPMQLLMGIWTEGQGKGAFRYLPDTNHHGCGTTKHSTSPHQQSMHCSSLTSNSIQSCRY